MERKWKKLRIERWHPQAGDQLEGVYRGQIVKSGRYGKYTAHVVHADDGGVFHVSGASADELLGMLIPPLRVRVVCASIRTYLAEDGTDSRSYRVYEVYIEDECDDTADHSGA